LGGTNEKNFIVDKRRTQNTVKASKHTTKGRGIACQLDTEETYPFWVSNMTT